MAAKNLSYAKDSGELHEAIHRILKQYQKQGGYVVDRNKCINFGSIFQDGIASYSNIDLFCERIFHANAITTLKKEMYYIKDEDQATIDKYNQAQTYVKQAATNPENATAEEIEKCKGIIEELEPIIQNIKPETKEVEWPFYVNVLTGEEFPLAPLDKVSEDNLKSYAGELARFVEVAKASITPAAFDPVQQPNGLSVMKVKALMWTDIVVR